MQQATAKTAALAVILAAVGLAGAQYIRSATPGGKVVIQDTGGDIELGPNRIKPPFAYGLVRNDGFILSRSPNVLSVTHLGGGSYRVAIAGGFDHQQDIAIVTALDTAGPSLATYYSSNGDLMVKSVDMDAYIEGKIEGGFFQAIPRNFSFVLYRP